jgi:ABC-type iron transport system FetAB ATPase subunit
MFARRRVLKVDPTTSVLTENIKAASDHQRDRVALLKDAHLVDAALVTDRMIASLDETARSLLARACHRPRLRLLGELVWVNPERESSEALVWLQRGAPPEASKELNAFVTA